MKVSKLISLDYDLVMRLKEEDNASALVNQILRSHYKDNRTEEQIISDVKDIIAKKHKKILKDKEFEKKLKKRMRESKKKGKMKGVSFDEPTRSNN